jgi:hypothetical protein
VIWFLERDSDVMVCEIRPATAATRQGSRRVYEFEISPSTGPARTLRFENATDLIDTYLREQAALRARGWHPRSDREQLD